MCEIVNPIYQHRILQDIQADLFNGLEEGEYFSEENGDDFIDYLTSDSTIALEALLDNFQAFIRTRWVPHPAGAGPPRKNTSGSTCSTPIWTTSSTVVGANMFLEVQTGRGRIDLLILHNQRKYIVETKIWEGNRYYQSGKAQLAAYLKLEEVQEGYYVVFDHRQHPASRAETETIDGVKIRSYVIPVIQERPSRT